MSDDVIDQFHGDSLVVGFREELRDRVFEHLLDFDPDGQDNHGHDESDEHLFAGEFAFELALDLSDRNEELLAVVSVKGELVDVAENAPVDKVADEADKASHLLALNLLFGLQDIVFRQCRLALLHG